MSFAGAWQWTLQSCTQSSTAMGSGWHAFSLHSNSLQHEQCRRRVPCKQEGHRQGTGTPGTLGSYLQEDVEDVAVRLLDLVKQHHRIRPPPAVFRVNGFGHHAHGACHGHSPACHARPTLHLLCSGQGCHTPFTSRFL